MVIGTSTGGLDALFEILPKFPKTDSYTILIVMHIVSLEAAQSLSRILNKQCQLEVKIATHEMPIESGNVYIMPCGEHHGMVVKQVRDIVISLQTGPKVNFVIPSIDVLMNSVAEVYKELSVGVLLTGMGKDGSIGIKTIKRWGGATAVQDEETSSVFHMPRAAIELGCVDMVLPLHKIPDEVMAIVDEKFETLNESII